MQEKDSAGAVHDRSGRKSWVPLPDNSLSIIPRSPDERVGAAQKRSCPEIDCLRDRLPSWILTSAERRAAEVGLGADRVLVTHGHIAEEDYVRALAVSCGLQFDPLIDVPRSACPLSDDKLIELAGGGILPLMVDGHFVFAIAPRGLTARRLAGRKGTADALPRHLRLTSTRHFDQFIIRHCAGALERRATEDLKAAAPHLSAAPRPRWPAFLKAAVLLLLVAGAFAVAPGQFLQAVNVMLAIIFIAWIGLRLFGGLARFTRNPRPERRSEDQLPIYTIIAALYREAASAKNLVTALQQFDYPLEKLDIKLVIEADDAETAAAIAQLRLGPPFQVIVAPAGGPRTKPKALNAALPFAQGTFTVVYDAEDRPYRNQLRRALDMFVRNPDLACVQARLTIDNTADSWLARLFTAEYAGQFDVFLPGLAALELPLPLGGSSNHFPTAVLREVGGWDPYNVTEDADLGMRLSRLGYRSAVIDTTTYEEAPAHFRPWLRQRTRWFKGWMQTWLVHMRQPFRLLRELGPAGFISLQLVLGGNVLAALVFPIFLAGAFHEFLGEAPSSADWNDTLLLVLHLTALVLGFLAAAFVGWLGLARRGLHANAWVLLLIPLHWMMLSLAAWRALYQLLCDPYRWEKTEHGLAQSSRRRERADRLRAAFPERALL